MVLVFPSLTFVAGQHSTAMQSTMLQ